MHPVRASIIEAFRTKTGMTTSEAVDFRRQYGYAECTKCGVCCRLTNCMLSEMLFADRTPCPMLKPEGCLLALELVGTDLEDTIREVLGIGCGCFLRGEGAEWTPER